MVEIGDHEPFKCTYFGFYKIFSLNGVLDAVKDGEQSLSRLATIGCTVARANVRAVPPRTSRKKGSVRVGKRWVFELVSCG
jgi:hypothetical protein